MPDIDIVLVAPLYEGNVGFAARVMKNFGFTRLVLIDPCPLGNEADGRASHAYDVLHTRRGLHHRRCVCPEQHRHCHDRPREQIRLPLDADAVLFAKRTPRTDKGCGRAHLDPVRARELGAQQRGGQAQRYDLHHSDVGRIPDPQPVARGRGCLL